MWLSAEQQALVTSHYHIAVITAKLRGNRRDPDESLSACHLGLCNAAWYWRPDHGVSFRNFAVKCCYHAMVQDYRLKRFAIGVRTKTPKNVETNCGPMEKVYEPPEPVLAVIRAEEVERVQSAACRLSKKQREVIELAMAGRRLFEIARGLGRKRTAVADRFARSVVRIRSVLGVAQ